MTRARRGRWLRWHRWLGLLLLLPILFLVITGVLISVSDWRGWQHETVHAAVLSSLYGVPPDVPETGYQAEDHWFVRQGGRLLFNTAHVARCPHALVGAVNYQDLIAAICGDSMLLLDHKGALIETLSGVPGAGQRLGLDSEGQLMLQSRAGIHVFDDFTGGWRDRDKDAIDWAREAPLPDTLRNDLTQGAPLPGISRERVLLDLHSGRLFGRAGVWIVNAAALLMSLLALSGAWTWASRLIRRG